VIRQAERSGVRVALVGGIVRDLLRGERTGRDVDLVVEGDATELARRAAPSGRVTVHPRFGTATVEGDGGFRMDLASARRESYPRPGALPEVDRATLEDDLARRDFSVNAIAWEPAAGRLHDPFGGATDLAAGRLRILHPRSFVDDPTRIFRAVRYANRLGLAIDPKTRRLLRSALATGALETVSADRLRHELAKIVSEPGWPDAIRLAEKWGLLAALEPGWTISPRVRRALVRAADLADRVPPAAPRRAWLAGLLVAASELRGAARRRLAGRLALSGNELRAFERDPEASEARTREEAIARAALARTPAERRILERRLTAPVRLSIRGADLVGEGVPAGPAVGRALGEARRALEEGRIEPGEQLAFALSVASRFSKRRDPK
jgi:tRNA nucleotidyltransferase (CCA-adding enzyme)